MQNDRRNSRLHNFLEFILSFLYKCFCFIIAYALVPGHINTGTLRETFFLNQLSQSHLVRLPKKGDFLVNDRYTFEVGGKNKTTRQIAGITDGYIVSDSLEYGHGKKLPLWIFGFLY